MIAASALDAQPSSWQRQWRDAVTDPRELLRLLGLPPVPLADDGAGFPLRVPRAFVDRMRRGDPHDPLLRQVLPLAAESLAVEGYGLDAVGDLERELVPGVLHKYEGRALLVTTGACAIHCRYCFRRHFPYGPSNAARERWRDAVALLAARPDLDEVILSGGDPLALATGRLSELTDALRTIPHVERLRIHTRLPVVLPDRVDEALVAWLRALPWPVVIVIHANHAREFDAAVDAALARLRASGATLLNQAVLLAGVNDACRAQVDLSRRAFAAGVLPYYLHQLDPVAGAAHFAVDDARALALHAELRAALPGYLVPRLVREIPGQRAKTPLTGDVAVNG